MIDAIQIRRNILLIVCVTMFAFVAYNIYRAATEPEPEMFPLDNPNATYTIIKSSFAANLYESSIPAYASKFTMDTTKSNDSIYKYYMVKYTGDHIFRDPIGGDFLGLVGKSKVELRDYIGKQVVIKGEFVSSSRKQCIVTACVDIGNTIVLNIDEIKLKE